MPNRFTPIQPGTSDDQKWNAVNNNFAQLDLEAINSFNIVKTGTAIIPAFTVDDNGVGLWAYNYGEVAVPHNLGFTPLVFAALDSGDGAFFQMMPYTSALLNGNSGIIDTFYCSANNTVAYFGRSLTSLHLPLSVQARTVRYYLLQERVS